MLDRVSEQAGRGVQFFRVLWNTIVTEGGELATEETIEQRLAICQACTKFLAAKNRCLVCGCKIRSAEARELSRNLGNKIAHKASSCPLAKWGPEGVQTQAGSF